MYLYVLHVSVCMYALGIKSTPTMVKVYLYANKAYLPSSLEATVSATYLTSKGMYVCMYVYLSFIYCMHVCMYSIFFVLIIIIATRAVVYACMYVYMLC